MRADGLSVTRIARALHISPTRFRKRVDETPELQAALRAGAAAHEANERLHPTRKPVAEWDAVEFETTVPLQPLDAIVLNAIEAGSCDRAAIERLLNPDKTRQIQITPSLERLIQHGKINELPPGAGIILTKYAIKREDATPRAKTANNEPRGILGDGRQNQKTQNSDARI